VKQPLPPPEGYDTWLDYAVINMPTRDLYLRAIDEGESITRNDMRDAVEAELRALRAAAVSIPTPKPYPPGRPTGYSNIVEAD